MIFVFLQQKLVDNGKSHRYTDTDHQQEAGGIIEGYDVRGWHDHP